MAKRKKVTKTKETKKAAKPRTRVRKKASRKLSQVASGVVKNKSAENKDLEPKDLIDTEGGQPTPKNASAKKKLKKRKMPDPDRHFVSVEDEVAQTETHLRNWYFPNASKYFPKPWQERMRRVTKYYPYAHGGPLAIDRPKDQTEFKECEKKKEIFATEGALKKIRYAIVRSNTEVYDILEQIGEE